MSKNGLHEYWVFINPGSKLDFSRWILSFSQSSVVRYLALVAEEMVSQRRLMVKTLDLF